MKKKGFTLIELIVTVAVMAIIVAFATPSFIDAINKRRLESAYSALLLTFSNARSQTVTIRQDVEVKLNSSELSTANLFAWKPDYPNLNLQSGSETTVIFEPTGEVKNFDNNKMTFSICNATLNITKRMQLTRMGSITMLADGTC